MSEVGTNSARESIHRWDEAPIGRVRVGSLQFQVQVSSFRFRLKANSPRAMADSSVKPGNLKLQWNIWRRKQAVAEWSQDFEVSGADRRLVLGPSTSAEIPDLFARGVNHRG